MLLRGNQGLQSQSDSGQLSEVAAQTFVTGQLGHPFEHVGFMPHEGQLFRTIGKTCPHDTIVV